MLLTANTLVEKFGYASPLAKHLLKILYDRAEFADQMAFDEWRRIFHQTTDERLIQLKPRRLPGTTTAIYPDLPRFLFATQTYYSIVVKLLALQVAYNCRLTQAADNWQSLASDDLAMFFRQVEAGTAFEDAGIAGFIEAGIYDWYLQTWSVEVAAGLAQMVAELADFAPVNAPYIRGDLLKKLYQNLIPASLRHQLGEYYTPDWIAEYILDQLGYSGNPATSLLDPTCGSGTFLVLALRRLLRRPDVGDVDQILAQVVGFDLNPLAALAARANYLLMLSERLPHYQGHIQLPVYCCDPVLQTPVLRRYDYVVGNPPWVNWQHLSDDYRQQTRPLWVHYGLFPHGGADVRMGKGKKDLAMLMTAVVLDRYLADGGQLGFIVPQSVFKSSGAGQGFRRFQLNGTMPVCVIQVDDLSNIRPFGDVQNRAAIVQIIKNQPTVYPLPYIVWSKADGAGGPRDDDRLKSVLSRTIRRRLAAVPVDMDDPTSPWLTLHPTTLKVLWEVIKPSAYRAHEGVNCGGANGVYWLEVLSRAGDHVQVRNLITTRAQRRLEIIEAQVEAELVYPLLRGVDVKRWQAIPAASLLFVQNPETRSGHSELWLQTNFPRTYRYLKHFEVVLRTRSVYQNFFLPTDAFYSMFGVGTYTVAPYKVVWRYLAREMTAAVVGREPATGKVIIPDHRLILIATTDEDEAHYLAACLNSCISRLVVAAHTINTQISTHILEKIGIPQYDSTDRLHRELARLSQQAHTAVANEQPVEAIETKIDQAAALLWGIGKTDLVKIQKHLRQR